MDIAGLREEYMRHSLDESDADPNPFLQFEHWFEEALQAGMREPTAMTLATCSGDGAPSARIVLLKGFDQSGFVFYTNYQSRKGRELAENPKAALLFYWPELEREVRIEGMVTKVTRQETEDYFRTRPTASQLGAHVSEQSAVIAGRTVLEEDMARLAEEFSGREIPPPAHWGGYRVAAESFEFWQGRRSRLHDRIRYRRLDSDWIRERLAP